MKHGYPGRLDRVFARAWLRDRWVGVRDAWEPAWKPRGRWWMRSGSGGAVRPAGRQGRGWLRLTRPGRAA